MKTTKILPLLIIGLIFISTMPINAANNEFIVPYNTPNTNTPGLVYCLHTQNIANEIETLFSTQEFQNYLQKNKINKYEYELKLISPYSNEPNTIMVHNNTHKWYYTIKNTKPQKNITPKAEWNRFSVVNHYGSILGHIQIQYYRLLSEDKPIPIDIHALLYNNVGNTEVITIDPSAEFTHASIAVFIKDQMLLADTFKFMVPLGNWHTANILKGKRIYIDLS